MMTGPSVVIVSGSIEVEALVVVNGAKVLGEVEVW